jgi:hypothetical protein
VSDREQIDNKESGSPKTGLKTVAMKVWRWSEIVLLIAGFAILAAFGVARLDSYVSTRAALKTFATLDEPLATSQNAGTPEDEADANEIEIPAEPDFAHWDDGRVHAYKQANAKESTALLAVLEIPTIHVLAPLLEGTDSLTLNRGVGRIKGTAWPGELGNIGIAGHRDSYFRSLKDIRTGDLLELRAHRHGSLRSGPDADCHPAGCERLAAAIGACPDSGHVLPVLLHRQRAAKICRHSLSHIPHTGRVDDDI